VASAALAALRAAAGPLSIAIAVGALAGAAWGLADEPEYAATAAVLLVDRGEAAEAVGDGSTGGGGPDDLERVIELAGSDDVAELAAASLGGDVAGADLVALTEFLAGDQGATLLVRSTASFPDFAAGTADAFAGAIVELGTVLERRRLRRVEQRLLARLEGLDPASEQALRLTERLDAVTELDALGTPLRVARPAELPSEPLSDRSVAGSALAGAGIAALLAGLVVLAVELRRRPVRRAGGLEAAAGAAVVGELGRALILRPAVETTGVRLDPVGADRMQAVAGTLGLADAGADARSLAVVSPNPGEGRTSVALGLAAAAALRGATVIVVEADLRRPAFGELLSLTEGPGLSEYLAGAASPREVIRTVPVAGDGDPGGDRPSFVCVAAGHHREQPVELLSGSRFRPLGAQLLRIYDLVIYDTPPLLAAPEATLAAAVAAGGVLCARSGSTRAEEVSEAAAQLEPGWLHGSLLVGSPHRGPGQRRLTPERGARLHPQARAR
jgi:Mrp family chromosome partitioning ATPase